MIWHGSFLLAFQNFKIYVNISRGTCVQSHVHSYTLYIQVDCIFFKFTFNSEMLIARYNFSDFMRAREQHMAFVKASLEKHIRESKYGLDEKNII